jgi:hypothetical protein
MTAPAWPPGLTPADRIPHSWRCSRPPAEDYLVTDPKTGESRVIKRCPSCGAVERGPMWSTWRPIARYMPIMSCHRSLTAVWRSVVPGGISRARNEHTPGTPRERHCASLGTGG